MSERREFLMLAHPYNPKKHNIKGWFYSEKMDGIRGLWDGGISRGLYKSEVPWANNDKDERYVEAQICTGFWSRYGNIIHAPDWFLNQMPDYPLDGEFFTDRKSWQTLSSAIKTIKPNDKSWEKVIYNPFEIPPYQQLFASGLVNNPNYVKQFDLTDMYTWAKPRIKKYPRFLNFEAVTFLLGQEFGNDQYPNIRNVQQFILESVDDLDKAFQDVLDLGGEGLIVRNPKSYWEPKRSHVQVKVKADLDDEATVTGYIWGRETDKGSKLLGLMGALILDYKGKRFELSGFTDDERQMTYAPQIKDLDPGMYALGKEEGLHFPGDKISQHWFNESFRVGTVVTFKYRELSDDGIPKEARFDRIRHNL